MNRTKRCLWCRRRFEIKRKRVALCGPCRIDRKRAADRERQRERSAAVAVLMSAVLPQLPPELHQRAYQAAREYAGRRDETAPAVHDIQAPGTKTAAGADEGHTTEFDDLAAVLAERAREATVHHPWWRLHPAEDVFFALGNDRLWKPAKEAA